MKLKLCIYILIAIFCLLGPAKQAVALSVTDIRFGLHPDKTRMVLELDETSDFRAFVLSDPYRIVIDLPSFSWEVGSIVKPGKSGVTAIRKGALNDGVSRIVVDLDRPMTIKSAFFLPEDKKQPDRLVLDFSAASASEFVNEKNNILGTLSASSEAEMPAPQPSAAAKKAVSSISKSSHSTPSDTASSLLINIARMQKPHFEANITKAPAEAKATIPVIRAHEATGSKLVSAIKPKYKPQTYRSLRKPTIIIDPGHGGVDGGATSKNGLSEEHIVLAMAKVLKNKLEATGRYNVKLTRSGDKYMRLYKRVNFARKEEGDLFISLHADSIEKSNVRGASIYTLSEKASDSQTERLAARENSADIIAGVDLSVEDKEVADILISLSMHYAVTQSNVFAGIVVGKMKRAGLKMLERPHREAGFAVLKAPDIPSVLVEIGFMSSTSDVKLMSSKSYRNKFSDSMVSAIDAYFTEVHRNNGT
jgi:N-acetylmuramoyl-L-alanine amidase